MENFSEISETLKVQEHIDAKVQRGPNSWSYIYVALGFTITIESVFITMIEPLHFPWNIILFVVVIVATGWLFLFNGRFQNKLLGWKNSYEDKAR